MSRKARSKKSNVPPAQEDSVSFLLTINSWGINPDAAPDGDVLPSLHLFETAAAAFELPTPIVLANLAAQPRFSKVPVQNASNAALDLYFACAAALQATRERLIQTEKACRVLNDYKSPVRWPGTLADFLKLVVRGKDKSESLPRFKRFVIDCIHERQTRFGLPRLSQKEELDEMERVLKRLQSSPGEAFSAQWWPWVAFAYQAWRKIDYRAAKQRGGRARAAKAAAARAAK